MIVIIKDMDETIHECCWLIIEQSTYENQVLAQLKLLIKLQKLGERLDDSKTTVLDMRVEGKRQISKDTTTV